MLGHRSTFLLENVATTSEESSDAIDGSIPRTFSGPTPPYHNFTTVVFPCGDRALHTVLLCTAVWIPFLNTGLSRG